MASKIWRMVGGHMTAYTDLDSHPITGFTEGGDGSVPLISEILPGLWMGGCVDGLRLPDEFKFVLSLYPWEQYQLGPRTERVEVRLYDSHEIPEADALLWCSTLVKSWRDDRVRVLVHCQAGLNRSGLITALTLLAEGWTPAAAIALLREKRSPLVLCNASFERYIMAAE